MRRASHRPDEGVFSARHRQFRDIGEGGVYPVPVPAVPRGGPETEAFGETPMTRAVSWCGVLLLGLLGGCRSGDHRHGPLPDFSATRIWVGPQRGDFSWSNRDNWIPRGEPEPDDIVLFPAHTGTWTIELDGRVRVRGLMVAADRLVLSDGAIRITERLDLRGGRLDLEKGAHLQLDGILVWSAPAEPPPATPAVAEVLTPRPPETIPLPGPAAAEFSRMHRGPDLLFSDDAGKTYRQALPAGVRLKWSTDGGRTWRPYEQGRLGKGSLVFLYSTDEGQSWSRALPADVRLLFTPDAGSSWTVEGGVMEDSAPDPARH